MLEDNLVKLCLPDPPTPMSRAFPLFCLSILLILLKCNIASLKKTKSIVLPGYYPLYLSRYYENLLGKASISSILEYLPGV